MEIKEHVVHLVSDLFCSPSYVVGIKLLVKIFSGALLMFCMVII